MLILAFTMCVRVSGTVENSGPTSAAERDIARIQGQLSTRDALLDASARQKEHFSKEGSYTSNAGLLTERASYVGVQLTVGLDGPNDYCMEALHDSGVVKHITERDERPRRGPCP